MAQTKVLLLRTAGTNCDRELGHAFTMAGAQIESLHINALLAEPGRLEGFQVLAFPGGFSYGDDIASGKILANQLIHHLKKPLRRFIEEGKLVLGVCNGFQVLVKAGILPGPMPQLEEGDWHPTTLTHNAKGRFEDRWVRCKTYSDLCKWVPSGRTLALPVAHGEGRFVARGAEVLEGLRANDQIVFRYVDEKGEGTQEFPANPNGSTDAIAGICDVTGRVLGMMPHPERVSDALTHPLHTRDAGVLAEGKIIFETAMKYVQEGRGVVVGAG